ncbi:TIGR03943 family putative permease subunit [Nocardioides lianchengensis]|uniref:TIGR03943 family putative permease subunit n=1 Tax=Nocardioides lianchengensis TaxID=1045774 RepID=UPI001481A8AC|nr:TIGR03943 family protein [Nocardioides lianchengensis]NYG09657.1 putative repeat protein (TIGR03943 family) [Nocardioides lianchengensis]
MAAVRRGTQGLLLALLGTVLLQLALSGDHLRYVTGWMRWPLVVCGVLLLAMALGPLLAAHEPEDDEGHDHDGHDHGGHGVPRVTWFLALPVVVAFVVSPPELGSFLAERQGGESAVVSRPDEMTALDAAQVVPVPLDEFIWRAQDGGSSLHGQPVELTGFVSYGDGSDDWFVTRMAIGCCAADARPFRVQVQDSPRPSRDQWVEVEGTHVPGTGATEESPPAVAASAVTPTAAPDGTYE